MKAPSAAFREFLQDVTAHILAVLLLGAFFALAIFVFLGHADVSNPTVASLVSYTLGCLSAPMAQAMMARYFKGGDPKQPEPPAPSTSDKS